MVLRKSLVLVFLSAIGMAMADGGKASALGEGTRFAALGAGASISDPVSNAADNSIAALPATSDHGTYFAPAMRFDADAGSLEVTFGIEEAAHLSLHAFDSQGKLLAVLLDGNQSQGFHHLSLFSNRLQGYKGHVIFQLRAGQAILGETRVRPG